MKFSLILITLLVGEECYELNDLRNRLPLKKSDIIKSMKKSLDDLRSYTILEHADIRKYFTRKSVGAYMEDASTVLTQIDDRFGRAALGYIKKRLLAYCAAVLKIIDEYEDQKGIMSRFKVNEIKFDVNQDFCIVPFLFNYFNY